MSVREQVEADLEARDGVPAVLREIAEALAGQLDDCPPMSAAAISKELRATLTAIDAAAPKKAVSKVDDLASRRAVRLAKPAPAKRAAKKVVSGKRGG